MACLARRDLKHLEIESRLCLARATLVVAKVELGVGSSCSGDAVPSGPLGGLYGNGFVAEVPRDLVPDGGIEAVVIAQKEVAAAQATVMLARVCHGTWLDGQSLSRADPLTGLMIQVVQVQSVFLAGRRED
jgi:hypothetical protein